MCESTLGCLITAPKEHARNNVIHQVGTADLSSAKTAQSKGSSALTAREDGSSMKKRRSAQNRLVQCAKRMAKRNLVSGKIRQLLQPRSRQTSEVIKLLYLLDML